jgi:hypothetical protein
MPKQSRWGVAEMGGLPPLRYAQGRNDRKVRAGNDSWELINSLKSKIGDTFRTDHLQRTGLLTFLSVILTFNFWFLI